MFRYQVTVLSCVLLCFGILYSSEGSGVADCGPQCVRYLSRYYNRAVELEKAYELCKFNPLESKSTNLLQLKMACESLGLKCLGIKGTFEVTEDPLFSNCSFIAQVERDGFAHFVVIVKAKNYGSWLVLDPSAEKSIGLSGKAGAIMNLLVVSDHEIISSGQEIEKKHLLANIEILILIVIVTVIAMLYRICRKKTRRSKLC
jgi:ABC-type bacteriocin/lantibiotic exporter with double-glycine peptidase domain